MHHRIERGLFLRIVRVGYKHQAVSLSHIGGGASVVYFSSLLLSRARSLLLSSEVYLYAALRFLSRTGLALPLSESRGEFHISDGSRAETVTRRLTS